MKATPSSRRPPAVVPAGESPTGAGQWPAAPILRQALSTGHGWLRAPNSTQLTFSTPFTLLTHFTLSLLLAFAPPVAAGEPPRAAAGVTEPFLDVTLSAPVPGLVAARPFKEGDAVKPGDVLLELDKRLEELEARRRQLVADQRRDDFEATKKLFQSTKGVSKEELDKKEVDWRVAAAEHEMAVEQLRRRQIVSPLTGAVTDVWLEVGEACEAYQPLLRVVDTRRVFLVCDVEARAAAGLKTGQLLPLDIDTGAGPVSVEGRITFISPVADRASGLIRVKALFENESDRLRPGLAGRMRLP
jgi:RND family efflux transporter MFP subunit